MAVGHARGPEIQWRLLITGLNSKTGIRGPAGQIQGVNQGVGQNSGGKSGGIYQPSCLPNRLSFICGL